MESRILGNIVGQEFTAEELEMITGGNNPICNGCQTSTQFTGGGGFQGCKCDPGSNG